jgi:hypothetical protein
MTTTSRTTRRRTRRRTMSDNLNYYFADNDMNGDPPPVESSMVSAAEREAELRLGLAPRIHELEKVREFQAVVTAEEADELIAGGPTRELSWSDLYDMFRRYAHGRVSKKQASVWADTITGRGVKTSGLSR